MPLRVFIADDHEIVRRGIRDVVEQIGGFQVVGEASDGWQVLRAPELDHTDVLLLDLSLPRLSGTEILRRVRQRRPDLPVVVLSMYPEDQYGPPLMAAGARAYLSKDRSGPEIIEAIRAAADGRSYVTDTLAGAMQGADAPHLSLTSREHQVFMLVIQGRTVTDIAAEIDVLPSTVSNHLARIREKLGARTIADIVHYAHRVGLVGSPANTWDDAEP
ncbi:MAG TPA: response regulator transcription factor [Myxococcota bacterium]|nr:response regulator transcription factor [Myxococcota bacterium]